MRFINKNAYILAFLVLITACQEIPPVINFNQESNSLKDTSYIQTNFTPQNYGQNVILEDISGVRCVNCPSANQNAAEIQKDNPNRVAVVTIHPTSLTQFTKPFTGEQNLSTQESENILTSIIGKPIGLPAGAINRKVFDNESEIWLNEQAKWRNYTEKELTKKTPVSIAFDTEKITEDSIHIYTKTLFGEKVVNANLNLTIMLLESKIIQSQSTPTGIVSDYEHNHVLRKTITPFNGTKLVSNINEYVEGQVFEKDFSLKLDSIYAKDNLSLVVFVHKDEPTDKSVLQVIEKKL